VPAVPQEIDDRLQLSQELERLPVKAGFDVVVDVLAVVGYERLALSAQAGEPDQCVRDGFDRESAFEAGLTLIADGLAHHAAAQRGRS